MSRPPRPQPVLSFEDVAYRRALGDKIRALRASRDMTQEQLADAARVSREYLSRVESGSRNGSVDVVARISKSLNVSLAELFSDC